MKKNAPKKLTLNRETVRTLEARALAAAAGAVSTYTYCFSTISADIPCESGSCNWSLCICQ